MKCCLSNCHRWKRKSSQPSMRRSLKLTNIQVSSLKSNKKVSVQAGKEKIQVWIKLSKHNILKDKKHHFSTLIFAKNSNTRLMLKFLIKRTSIISLLLYRKSREHRKVKKNTDWNCYKKGRKKSIDIPTVNSLI